MSGWATDARGDKALRVLFITEFFPESEKSVYGAFQRMRRHIDALRELGTVDLVFLWPEGRTLDDADASQHAAQAHESLGATGKVWFIPVGLRRRPGERLADLFHAGRGAIGFFHQRPSTQSCGGMPVRMLRRIIDQAAPGLIFAHRLGVGAALLRMGAVSCPVVLDLDDVEHVALERRARSETSLVRRATFFACSFLARFAERRIAAAVSRVLVCSELDRRKLLAAAPRAKVSIAANSAASYGQSRPGPSATAAFVGIAHYRPNREAILWLVNDIWRRVVAAVPDARLLIAGDASKEILLPEVEGVEVLGFVPDLAAVYRRARIVVCPVKRGSGTRIKIIEAALNGKPVVSTTIGAEGLSFEAGSEIVLADDAESFASRCIELLADTGLAETIGTAAKTRAERLYSPEAVRLRLVALCAELIAPK